MRAEAHFGHEARRAPAAAGGEVGGCGARFPCQAWRRGPRRVVVRSLALQSVAEGVETEQEMRILQSLRCDVVQGFLFSPALPVAKLIDFLEHRAGRTA